MQRRDFFKFPHSQQEFRGYYAHSNRSTDVLIPWRLNPSHLLQVHRSLPEEQDSEQKVELISKTISALQLGSGNDEAQAVSYAYTE